MTRFPVFFHSQRSLGVLTVVVTALSVPATAAAQTPAAGDKSKEKEGPATIQAEQMSGRPDREVMVERNVEIIRGPSTVNADKATYNIVEDEVTATGNVRMQRSGARYTGDELKLKQDTGQGYITHPTYHLDRTNAQGKAQRIDFESEERSTITDGTYSTCEGPDPDWYLKADTLRLDRGRDIGIASTSIVFFKGVPILGTPLMSFPLSGARKSGFLIPTYGGNSKGGLEVTVPYYFNIAPNRDLTLYPTIIARRGLQLGADGRYLDAAYTGQTKLEVLFNDQQTSTNRYAISSLHAQTLAPGLSLGWNLNHASDDDYPNDFSRSITATSVTRQLARNVSLSYAAPFWNAGVLVSNYQVLQDPASPIERPASRLPQFSFQAGRQDVKGFDWFVDTELTRFSRVDLPRGDRLALNSRVSYPIIHQGYFVTPKLSVDVTKYRIENNAGATTDFSRSLPTFSVDSGLIFERDARFFGQSMTQTLEPRLFYVKTPYRDQSQFPLFDTTEPDLSFSQLFSENRFIGRDRIGDANQLAAAVTTRFIEPSGAERMRIALGHRFYFTQPLVSLDATADPSRSDSLLAVSGRLTPTLRLDGNIEYSESLHKVRRASYGVQWQPAPMKVLNVLYSRNPGILPDQLINSPEQLVISGQWPIARRWYLDGRVNYALPNSQIIDTLAVLEYKADCWVFRTGVQRIPTATNKATTSFFFQLQLNGLGGLGPSPMEALRTNVPGYQTVTQPR